MRCRIVNAQREVLNIADVQFVGLRGSEGELGIAPGHTALLTRIEPGPLTIKLSEHDEQIYYVAGGILEVQPNMVIILADIVEQLSDDMNEESLLAKAQELKSQNQGSDFDAAILAQLAVIRAQVLTLELVKLRRKK